MWRCFFLAAGISLMLLGVEALVFERVVINETAKLPKFLDGIFEKNSSDSFTIANRFPRQNSPALQDSGIPSSPNSSNFQRVPFSSGSRFGPSRFSGPQSGGYGGGRVDLSRSGINSPSINSNNVQAANAFPVSFPNGAHRIDAGGPSGHLGQIQGPRTIVTKDWMPWSLLASGAIIFLYTSSHSRSKSEY